jgi:hypothetical protein
MARPIALPEKTSSPLTKRRRSFSAAPRARKNSFYRNVGGESWQPSEPIHNAGLAALNPKTSSNSSSLRRTKNTKFSNWSLFPGGKIEKSSSSPLGRRRFPGRCREGGSSWRHFALGSPSPRSRSIQGSRNQTRPQGSGRAAKPDTRGPSPAPSRRRVAAATLGHARAAGSV